MGYNAMALFGSMAFSAHAPSLEVDEWPLSCALRSSAFFSVFVDLYVLDTFTVV